MKFFCKGLLAVSLLTIVSLATAFPPAGFQSDIKFGSTNKQNLEHLQSELETGRAIADSADFEFDSPEDDESWAEDTDTKACSTKYVQGGLTAPGNGSKSSPWNSLALAQANTSWKTLVVLPSATALDGGILMRPGTRLIGAKNPVKGTLAANQPTITNSSAALNGGNGVVVESGNVYVKNIYLKDTWASGINYNNAKCLEAKNVLITGHNQGEVVVPMPYPFRWDSIEVGGIHGINSNNGTTILKRVVIKNNHTGSAVVDFPNGTVTRKLRIGCCEFSNLTKATPLINEVYSESTACFLAAIDDGTNYDISITKSSFHDFALGFDDPVVDVIAINSLNGATVKCLINNCDFTHIYPIGSANFAHGINFNAFTVFEQVPANVRSKADFTVCNCTFQELPTALIGGISTQNLNSDFNTAINRNSLIDVFDSITLFAFGGVSNDNVVITNNNGSGTDNFFGTETFDIGFLLPFGSNPPPQATQTISIKGNNYTGGNLTGAIAIVPVTNPWTSLIINAEDNCFNGQGAGAGLAGFNFGSVAGNATINAHKNNITGFQFDIQDVNANVNYLAQKNWWGQASGADSISTQPGYTGTLDVSNPLKKAIKCPKARS